MKVSVILPAAGQGKRFGSRKNKILQSLAGRSVLAWSLKAFSSLPEVKEIVLVGNATDLPKLRKISKAFPKASKLVLGGKERFDSVWAGLQASSPESEIVLIHDAARPLIEKELIRKTIQSAKKIGGAIVAIPSTDTAKRSIDGKTILKTVPREGLWRAQTPQGFRRGPFLKAYEKAVRERLQTSDDAAVAEHYGIKVALVPGSGRNLKITTREDLRLAELLLSGTR